MSELTYINKNGDTVFTSTFLKNRKTCCKTSCLHCPYGHTLKTDGLTFDEVTESRIEEAQFILDGGKKKEEFNVTASLLAGAFGAPKKITPISVDNIMFYQFILIKDQICGLLRKDVTQVKEVYLLEHFQDQDLTLETVSSFYNS